LAARRLGGHEACEEVARSQLHWLWGQNPFGLSFQIGVGRAWPQHPHHSFAATAHVLLEGAIVGGPSAMRGFGQDPKVPQPGPGAPYARFSVDALGYDDETENWMVNEPALDFTAPFVFLLGELAE